MGLNGLNRFNELTADNTRSRGVQTQTKIAPPPPKGYTRISIDVTSNVGKDKDGKVMLSDMEVERAVFAYFGLPSNTEADLQNLKTRLGTTENPFDNVVRSNANRINYQASGNYHLPIDVKNSLYAKLAGKAAEIKQQIKNEQKSQTSANPNEATAVKNGTNTAQLQRAKLDKLLREAQVLPTNFGIPSKLTDLTHVVVTLPAGDAPTADNALSAYIERRFGGGSLWGPEKRDILNTAKLSGVKVENLQVSPNNSRVVEFDLNLESLLKLQKTYLDVQEKVNADVAIADKARDEMALNQFVLGVIQGAKGDIFGSVNALIHPLETLQGVRDAVNILSQLTAADVKNIAAELGNKALNATPGEAAYGAGYVVGIAVVEILLAKGTGAALSALGKTKAGAEFLARIGKLADKTGELANLGKLKIAEAFSNEAAALAKQRLLKNFPVGQPLVVLPGAPLSPQVIADFSILVGNKIGKGVTSFREIVSQLSREVGGAVKPHLDELAAAYRDSMKKLGLKADENEIISVFKDWQIERAKNINEIIDVPKSSELDKGGWLDRKNFRRELDAAKFPNYPKHIKARTVEEAKSLSLKEAQFLPDLKGNLKEIYKQAIDNAVSNGLVFRDGEKYYFFHRFDKPIGYNLGKETKWIRVEFSSRNIHGHPTNLETVRGKFPQVKE